MLMACLKVIIAYGIYYDSKTIFANVKQKNEIIMSIMILKNSIKSFWLCSFATYVNHGTVYYQ